MSNKHGFHSQKHPKADFFYLGKIVSRLISSYSILWYEPTSNPKEFRPAFVSEVRISGFPNDRIWWLGEAPWTLNSPDLIERIIETGVDPHENCPGIFHYLLNN